MWGHWDWAARFITASWSLVPSSVTRGYLVKATLRKQAAARNNGICVRLSVRKHHNRPVLSGWSETSSRLPSGGAIRPSRSLWTPLLWVCLRLWSAIFHETVHPALLESLLLALSFLYTNCPPPLPLVQTTLQPLHPISHQISKSELANTPFMCSLCSIPPVSALVLHTWFWAFSQRGARLCRSPDRHGSQDGKWVV